MIQREKKIIERDRRSQKPASSCKTIIRLIVAVSFDNLFGGVLERESGGEGNLGGERKRGERRRGAFWSPLKELGIGNGNLFAKEMECERLFCNGLYRR